MKEYGHLLKDDPEYAEKAAAFSALVKDISEYLVALPFRSGTGHGSGSRHLSGLVSSGARAGMRAQPRAILQAIPGLEFVEMPQRRPLLRQRRRLQPDAAADLLATAAGEDEAVAETRADIVATANTGCMMQLEAGLRRFGPRKTQMAHVVELLDEAYRALDDEGKTG